MPEIIAFINWNPLKCLPLVGALGTGMTTLIHSLSGKACWEFQFDNKDKSVLWKGEMGPASIRPILSSACDSQLLSLLINLT